MGKSSFKSWWWFSLACAALSSMTGLFFWWGTTATSAPAPTAAAWNYASFYQSQVGDLQNIQAVQTQPVSSTTPPALTRPTKAQSNLAKNQTALVTAVTTAPATTAAITSDWDKAQLISNEYSRMLASNEILGPEAVEKQPTPAANAPVVTVRAGIGQYNPIGPPSISLAAFAHFLQVNNSPAYPEAASMYQYCLKLSCDPAVALAFFNHESSMGRAGAAVSNKSFGNIRCTAGSPCDNSSGGGFKIYNNWTEGLIDWAILLKDVYAAKFQLFTLEQIIPVYAPAEDHNQPVVYINTVKNLVDQYRAYRP